MKIKERGKKLEAEKLGGSGGLTSAEAARREKAGDANKVKRRSNQSYFSIVFSNLFTYFNLIFAIISILLISCESYRELTFLPVIIANVAIGIFQQIRSKIVIDRLNLLAQAEYTVIRDGKEIRLPSAKLVLGDLVILKGGQQIPADCRVESGSMLVNESLLTGEADEIEKEVGSELKSGSFVISGSCRATLVAVGKNSYSAKLMAQAKEIKDKKSEMIKDVERIILFAGIAIIPVGVALFVKSFGMEHLTFKQAVESMVGAIIGMIPEGMYLLTTVALALSAIRLGKENVLLHDMRSTETLARVDVLCVDKTGTITENEMTVTDFVVFDGGAPVEGMRAVGYREMLASYVATITDENATFSALKRSFVGGMPFEGAKVENFNSSTKRSEIILPGGETYKLGAPERVLSKETFALYEKTIAVFAGQGKRVLAFVKDGDGAVAALVCLKNELRENAADVFGYFDKQGVGIRVISGDNPITVSRVAAEAGIKGAEKYIDASTLVTDEDIKNAVLKYVVFGRVTPEQKKKLVLAFKANGLKVAMTGDGVNDILAMKEADCSIAMGSGSDAAREAAQVVLLDSDFAHMKSVVSEGRRDVNNITRTATLFLYKNIFSLLLGVFSILSLELYPLKPSQISLISLFNIGIPAFLLTLENNEARQRGKFIVETLTRSFPAAVTSFFAIVALVSFSNLFALPYDDISTSSTYLLAVGGFIIMWNIIRPVNKYRFAVMAFCVSGFALAAILFPGWFDINPVSLRGWVLCALFAIGEASCIRWISLIIQGTRRRIEMNAVKKKQGAEIK